MKFQTLVMNVCLCMFLTFYSAQAQTYPNAVASSGITPNYVLDDNYQTIWRSGQITTPPAQTEWVYVDYGSPKTFNTICMIWGVVDNEWESDYAQSFNIYVSNDTVNWTLKYSTDNGGKGVMMIPVGMTKARYVKIECTEAGQWDTEWGIGYGWYYMIAEISTYIDYPYETASSSANGFDAYKALDNDMATGWRSDGGGVQTYTISYADTIQLCYMTLVWGDDYAASYTVEASDDSIEWKTVYNAAGGDGGVDDFWLEIDWYDPDPNDNDWNYIPKQYKYVRLNCTAGGAFYELREFRVFLGNRYPFAYASEAWQSEDRKYVDPDVGYIFCPGMVTDGSLNDEYSRWASGSFAKDQWVYVDLGAEQTFDEMKIYWHAYNSVPDQYTLSGSVDGITWNVFAGGLNPSGNIDIITFGETIARFIKLELTKEIFYKGQEWPYSINEMYIIPGALGTSCWSYEWGSKMPFYAVDGDLTKPWMSIPPWGNWGMIPSEEELNDQAVTIDYGTEKATFNTIILYWDGWFAKSYSIDISDGLNGPWTTKYSASLGDGGTDLISLDETITTQYLRIHCTERGDTTVSYGIQEVVLEERIQYPIATASSYEWGCNPYKAIDESDATRWASDRSDPQWIQIDYGELRQFNDVRLYWETAYAKSYQIQTSSNGQDWATHYSTTNGQGGDETVQLDQTVSARYIRMYGTERGTGWGYSLWDFRPELTVQHVRLVGKQLQVDGEPFIAKGMCYGATPVGQNHNYDWSGDSDMYNIDFPLLQQMGCNTIRLYKPPLNSAGMDAAYEHGIYAIMGYDIAQSSDITDQEVRNAFKTNFTNMVEQWKDHPAVLMWAIANEMNLHVPEPERPQWYSLVDTCAMLAKQIEGANYHPVTTVGIEVGDIAKGDTVGAADYQMTHLDIWSVNIYRGRYFFDLFALDKYQSWTEKPMCITEFGCDVYDTFTEQEYQTPQAEYQKNWWTDMLANSGALNPDKPCIGGTVFQWSDDWNKQGNPGGHDTWPTGGCWNLWDSEWDPVEERLFPNWQDEWCGVVGISPGTYDKTIRESYYALQEVWSAPTVSDNFDADTQPNYRWFGASHSYNAANKTIDFYAANSPYYVAMNQSINASEAAVQADFNFSNTIWSYGTMYAFLRVTPGTDPGSQDSYCGIININDDGYAFSSIYRTNGGIWYRLVDSNIDNYTLPDLNEWHTIKLSARNNRIVLFFDGSPVSSYTDSSALAITAPGDVSVQSAYGNAAIDNFFTIKCGSGYPLKEKKPAQITADLTPDGVVLTWQGLPDKKLSRFEVFRQTKEDQKGFKADWKWRSIGVMDYDGNEKFVDNYIQDGELYRYNITFYDNKGNIVVQKGAEITINRDDLLPTTFAISQNYPNPFNPTTTINYQLPVKEHVKLVLYNILGEKVRTLVNKEQSANYYKVIWNGRNDAGRQVASGIYFYMVNAGEYNAVKKMILLR